MIDYIKGTLGVKEIGFVALETHGVGYAIHIPLSTYEALPAPGSETRLHIHFIVREDAHKLYGFYTAEERMLFRQLISISKIGPKVALSVLSGVSVNDLVLSVNNGDPSRLKKIPGVGAKTAERLVLELKGKLGIAHSAADTVFLPKHSGTKPQMASIKDEVFAAMVALGYNDKQVVKALDRVAESGVGAEEPVEVWIRKALQVI